MKDSNIFKIFSKPILFIALLASIAGIYSYEQTNTNLFPEVLFPRITIIADAGQMPADKMMVTTTKPIESAVKKVKGVTVVKSSTSRGSTTIDVFFEWGLDTYIQKLNIESRINEIKGFLPQGLSLSIEAMNQSLFPVYGYTLENPNTNLVALKDKANLLVRPMFSQVDGIANVIVRGGKSKDYVIVPDPSKMKKLGIIPNDFILSFNANNFVQSSGMVNDYERLYLTISDTRVYNVDDIGDIILKNNNNRLIKVKDVAKVEVKEQVEFIKINANGNDAVIIDLVKQPGVNLIPFAKALELKANEIKKQLPKGYKLIPYYNQSAFVGDSINSVIKTIYEGLFLAIIVMILFLQSWRSSLVVMLTIPVTLTFTILVLYLFGITINIMSLGAIAASIGLIIDDAIVIIEQIYRTHEEQPKIDKYQAVKISIKVLFPAMVASSLSTIVIHFPFGLMSGLAGSFFKELSDTMQITMVVSFFVTWLLLPVLHILIGYKHKPKKEKEYSEEKMIGRLSWLTWFFNKPIIAIGLMLIFILGGYYSSTKLETGFLPDLDEGTIVLDYFSPPGTSISETDRLCKQMETIILENPNVESYSRRTGMRMAFKTVPSNFGDYLIQLKQNRTLSTEEVISQLRSRISNEVPVIDASFGQRIADLLGDLMSTPQPIEIKLFGDDYNVLQEKASQIEDIISKIKGIVDIDNGLVTNGPSIVFLPKKEVLSLYNISLTDFQNQLSAYVGGNILGTSSNITAPSPAQAAMSGGLQIGDIQEGEQMRRLLLRYEDYNTNHLEKIKKQLIFSPNGTVKPLSFYCDVKLIDGEIEQHRENLKSNIVIAARLENRDLGSAIKEIKQQLSTQLNLPKGYYIDYGGAYAQQQKSFNELLMILSLATLLVFAVLLFLFKEWLLSFTIILISVIGVTGCLMALYLTNIPLNVSSYTGIIMVVGIIAENSIFTVFIFKDKLKTHNFRDAVNYSIALRLRPKLMTAIGAILALTPLALGIGLGAQMQQPLAIAVIGGFVVGLPLLLLVLPSLLELIYKNRK